MKKRLLTMVAALFVTMVAVDSAEANTCWFDRYGNVQNGWIADYNVYANTTVCCPHGTDYYESATNTCRRWVDYNPDYRYDSYRDDSGIMPALIFALFVGLLYWAYTEGWASSSPENDEPCRPVATYEPPPEPRPPRPKVILHEFHPKAAKAPDIVYVSTDGRVAKAEKPAAPAPEPKSEERPVINPSGNDFVKRRAQEYVHEWGETPDRAARMAQEEFKTLSFDKKKREMRDREGLPPKKT